MPMIDMPVTPVYGAEVVIERRVGEAGNRGLSPVSAVSVSPVSAHSAEGLHALGVCQLVETHRSAKPVADFYPVLYANSYYFKVKRRDQVLIKNENAEIRIVRQPKHGKLEFQDPVWAGGLYLPDDGYLGNDSFMVQVTGNGQSVNIHYFMRMVEEDGGTILDNKNCKSSVWKISLPNSSDQDGPALIASNWVKTPTDRLVSQIGEPFVRNQL